MITKMQLLDYLEAEERKYKTIIDEAQNRLETAPSGSVHIVRHGKGWQYFRRTEGEKAKETYIPVKEKELAHALIQKRYDQQIVREAIAQCKVIRSFLRKYDPEILEGIYDSASEGRKEIIIPAAIPFSFYSEWWQNMPFEGKAISEEIPEHYTQKEERVRSKSEVLIANALAGAGLPYRYECPLRLNYDVIHPDFTILRNDKEEIFWEHFGMMDDSDYLQNALRRIRLYESCGIYPGEKLIITAETSRFPLNLPEVNRMIRHFF